ncbi:hypothetical protein ACFLYR_04725 [Chloroflexota bacterium]
MVKRVNNEKKGRGPYIALGLGILLTVLVVGAMIYFWDEMQEAAAYGYAGCFVVTIAAGMTVIPAPALAVVFTLGHKLSPLYVGLVAGLGEALGGATVYLTGVGGGTIWTRLRARQRANNKSTSLENDDVPLVGHGFQSKQRAFFNRIVAPMQRGGGFWPVFLASAIVFSPFYVVGLGAGALGMDLRKFFLISWAGKTIKGLYVAFAGYWGLYFLSRWLGG